MAVRHLRTRVLSGIAVAALAGGCADDGVSLHVVCPIPPTIEEGGCTWDPASNVCVAQGVLNVRSAASYRLNLRVDSGLKARARDVPVVAEPNGAQVTRARVEVRTPGGGLLQFAGVANPFDATATGYVQPAGRAIVSSTVIPTAVVQALDAAGDGMPSEIVLAVQLHGKTDGDQEVESGEFLWPLRLVRINPVRASNECLPVDSCASAFGQDGFAAACIGGDGE
jgi:hypothetical protein